MIDVFISYAREDRAQAAELAQLLEQAGYTVWWDWKLIGGHQYRDIINQKLTEAKKVIVLWSTTSVASAFVIDEAQDAKDQNKLIPIAIDKIKPPLGFRDIHTLYINKFSTVIEMVISSIEGDFAQPPARETLFSRYHKFLFAPQRLIVPLTTVISTVFLILYLQQHNSLDAKFTVYHSSELKATFNYPSNILSLNDRKRNENQLFLQDGEGQIRVKINRGAIEDTHDVKLAREHELAALEKMNNTVTYVAPEKEKNWSNWYVLSGVSNNTVFYFRRWYEKDSILSMEFFFPKNQQPLYEFLIPNMVQNFVSDTADQP